MADEVAILVIHGMGSQSRGYSRDMQEEINDRLGDDDASRVRWEEVFWSDILEPRQMAYLRRANADNSLDYVSLRRFVLSALADAVAYRKTSDSKNATYELIHGVVDNALDTLELVVQPTTPLIVMAHSLGGHIMSNYIWDLQKRGAATGLSPFRAMKTLAGFITFGCNIPLFTMAYDRNDIKPIRFPGSRLPAGLKDKARWLNFYDPDDVLGYPLRTLNTAYAKVVYKDTAINVGGILTSWNPASHSEYWTDNDFTRPVARFIRTLL